MIKTLLRLLGVSLVLAAAASAQGFWQPTNGPFGPNEINRIFIASNGTVYLHGDSIMKSSNTGNSWTGINDSTFFFQAFLANDNGDLYGGEFQGLRRSTNGGTTWNTVNLGISPIQILGMTKNSAGNLFVGTNNHVFRSTDNGANWNRYTTGLTQGNVYNFAFASSNIVVAGTAGGLFRSTDNGATWAPVGSTTEQITQLARASTGAIFAGTGKGVFRSTDNGATWTDKSAGLADSNAVAVGADSSGNVYVGTSVTGVYKSSNGGDTWALLAGLYYPFADAIGFAQGNLIVLTRAAMYRSADGGSMWTALTTQFPPLGARGIYVHSNGTVFAGTFAGHFKSTDNGATWNLSHTGLPSRLVVSWVELPNNVLIAGTYYGGIYKSTDNGSTWTYLAQSGKRAEGMTKDDSGNLYHAFDGGVAKSTDNGATWSLDTAGLGNTYTSTMMIAANGSRYASSNSGLYRWKTGETQWTRMLGTGNFTRAYQAIAVSGSNLLTNIGYSPTATETGVWLSTNNGDTWTHIASPDSVVQRMTVNSLGHVYLASKTGVYKSTTNGDSWTQVSTTAWPGTSKTNISVNAFAFASDGTLYAATSYAIYKSAQSTTSVERVETEVPRGFSLSQNYPNPFNPSTKIGFRVSGSGFVSLKVFDVLGREVATLVNQELNPGTYKTTWNAAGMPSGVYFYTLRSGESVQINKMILTK